MTGQTPDDFSDDLFHACALHAFIDQAILQGRSPDQEATRQRAYRYYEEALAAKNAGCDAGCIINANNGGSVD